jgi:hypothetical protein
MSGTKSEFPCPCCGYLTFGEPPGSDDICDVCGWENDFSMLRFPTMGGGANHPSLKSAQRNFAKFGVSDPRLRSKPRQQAGDVERDAAWRPIDLILDNVEEPLAGVDYGVTYPKDRTELYYWRPNYWRKSNIK